MFTVKRIGEIVRQLDALRYPISVPLTGWKTQVRSGETRAQLSGYRRAVGAGPGIRYCHNPRRIVNFPRQHCCRGIPRDL